MAKLNNSVFQYYLMYSIYLKWFCNIVNVFTVTFDQFNAYYISYIWINF